MRLLGGFLLFFLRTLRFLWNINLSWLDLFWLWFFIYLGTRFEDIWLILFLRLLFLFFWFFLFFRFFLNWRGRIDIRLIWFFIRIFITNRLVTKALEVLHRYNIFLAHIFIRYLYALSFFLEPIRIPYSVQTMIRWTRTRRNTSYHNNPRFRTFWLKWIPQNHR